MSGVWVYYVKYYDKAVSTAQDLVALIAGDDIVYRRRVRDPENRYYSGI
jgi:hypothetical protein